MDFIKYLDIFSIKFNFYTNNETNYQNKFGGIITFSYVFLCFVLFVAYSIDDLLQLNPITTTSEITDSQTKLINLNKEKVWIPFRMVNYENKFIDHRGILHIVPYLIEGRYNDEIGMDLKYHTLKYKLCNETSMANKPYNYKINIPLNELFCFERDDILFGGNWNYDFLNYIELNLYLCEDGIAYNSSDPRCSKLDNYLKNINTSLLINFFYPMVQFQPTNLETPIEIIYKNYYYRLTSYSYKVQKLYLREHILSDDTNILRTKYKNNSCWGMSLLYSDDYFLPSEFDAISDNSNTSRIYALNIYMDDGLVYYTRTYKKILLIISNFFPILRVIFYFIKKLVQHVKMSFTKRKLVEIIFESNNISQKKFSKKKFFDNNSEKNSNRFITASNKSENELIKDKNYINFDYNNLNNLNYNKNNLFFKNNIINEEKENDNNKAIYYNNFIFNKRLTISSNEDDNKKINNNNTKNNISSFNKSKTINDSSKNNKIINNKEKAKYIFPFYYYFLDILFDRFINPQKFFCISKAYFTVYNFMCRIYDISTYILLFKDVNLLNHFLKENNFEENDFYKTKLFKKTNIYDNKIVEKINSDLKNRKSIFYSKIFL